MERPCRPLRSGAGSTEPDPADSRWRWEIYAAAHNQTEIGCASQGGAGAPVIPAESETARGACPATPARGHARTRTCRF